MVVRMRRNHSETAKRRSHHALTSVQTSKCECGALRRPHNACSECGKYKGRVVIDVVALVAREARRTKRREKELKESGQITETKNAEKQEK